MDKKELKKPDEFLTWGARATQFASENAALVLGGTIVCVVLIASFFFWLQRRDAREVEAAGALYRAEKLMEAQQDPALAGFRMPAFNKPKPEDVKAAIEKLEEVAREYPRTKAALRAKAKIGDAYVELEQWDDAITAYQGAVGGTPVERYYALNGLAHAYERKESFDDAASTYRRIVDDPNGFGRDIAALDLARSLERAGKKDAAIQVLTKFTSDFPDSRLKSEAERRLASLGGAVAQAPAPATAGTGGT